ncbi:beta-trefoil DNA-binding domain-containing protein, partial [Halteromyces radiatus]|uniref:beta-trefoil DNA-binding domain-containing protein n=1 Tax=Halteromyces radiatus TaxID=101107 RepID=UPI0022207436
MDSPPHSSSTSAVISQQVYGSSKKLQFIGINPMNSLLKAIDQQTQQATKSTQQTMSIESLLDSNGETPNKRRYVQDSPSLKTSRRKPNPETITTPSSANCLKTSQMTTITCYHAAVAQKSYGSEKRFLCPPPVVRIQSPNANITSPSSSPFQLTMAVVNDNDDKPLEQHAILDDDQCTFKYLHVTGTAKAKQFSLRVNITSNTSDLPSPAPSSNSSSSSSPSLLPSSSIQSYATFLSNPISIISKPSKKTAKARNVSTCILTHQPVSLFNRINSQTVRTKYMTSENNQLCAKNSTWSPFEIIVLSQPSQYQSTQRPTSTNSSNNNNNNNAKPLIYGSELILRDTRTGVRSQPLLIRKVDKGRIVPGAYGPVSQMQKVAFQLVSSSKPPRNRTLYLSAIGATEASESGVTPAHSPHVSLLDYSPSRMIPEGLDAYEKVDDYICWTIVGIATFEYTSPSSSSSSLNSRCITPFPVLTSIQYKPLTHTLDIVGQHLMQAVPSPKLLQFWLGSHHGPLRTTVQPQPSIPHRTHLLLDIPSTQDLVVANHDRLINDNSSRTLELPLFLVREDGVVYHSGK